MACPLRFHWSSEDRTPVEWAGMESMVADSMEEAERLAAATNLAFRIPYDDRLISGRLDPRRLIVSWKIAHADVDATAAAMARCRAIFPGAAIEVEGDTTDAAWIAIKHADRLFRLADRLEQAYADALPVMHMGVEVGLTAFVIARRTRDEAVDAAGELFGTRGVLAGSFAGVAEALAAYGRKGISHILIRHRPGHDDLTAFAEGVLPRVREWEQGRSAVA
jgi:hypothetical protein